MQGKVVALKDVIAWMGRGAGEGVTLIGDVIVDFVKKIVKPLKKF